MASDASSQVAVAFRSRRLIPTSSPALHGSRARIDRNGDGLVTEEELRLRMDAWFEVGASLLGAVAQVTLDGQPLDDVEIVVEPESFLGDACHPLTARTDEDGMATFAGHELNLPGVLPGFYTIRISKRAANGREQLDKRYNAESTLGIEVAGDRSNLALFQLRSG